VDRRIFLMSSAATLAAAPSDQLRVGLIGAGGRGRYLAGVFERNPEVQVAAVCDVYEPNLEKELSELSHPARAYRNYKQLLEDNSIDAVIIATPEHWHPNKEGRLYGRCGPRTVSSRSACSGAVTTCTSRRAT